MTGVADRVEARTDALLERWRSVTSLAEVEDAREVASAQIALEEEQQLAGDAYASLLNQRSVKCIFPQKSVQMSPDSIRKSSFTFCITPDGNRLVFVSTHWFNFRVSQIRIDGMTQQPTLSWDKVMSPIDKNVVYQAVNGIAYEKLGFVLVGGTYMTPAQQAYEPFAARCASYEMRCEVDPDYS